MASTTVRTKAELTPAASNRMLERACNYVSDLWFPANPELVSKIRTTLEDQGSNIALDHFISEIQGDCSLFLFCMKRMVELLLADGVAIPDTKNPLEILHQGGIEHLKQILKEADNGISRHFFDGVTESQAQCFQEAIVSASTVRVLSNQANLDPELGFFSALLRQLGYTLIAWNYPSVFQSAKELISDTVSLEAAISQKLGFSPMLLAASVVHRWQLPMSLRAALEAGSYGFDPEEQDAAFEAEALGKSINELCRIGEALARANNPETYPTARTDWDYAHQQIIQRLGADGITTIRDAIAHASENYAVSIPHFFRGGTILDPEVMVQRYQREEDVTNNPFILKCLPHVQEKLLDLYAGIREGHSIQSLVRRFSEETLPASGFIGACVYTVDPSANALMPQLQLGCLKTKKLCAVFCDVTEHKDLVSLAYKSDQPVYKTLEDQTVGMATIFGHSQRVGVVYLVLPETLFKGAEAQHVLHLRAFAIALNDCLHLN